MENKINLVELLKDCPKGMELDCTLYDNCTFEEIEDVGYIYIVVNTPSGRIRLSKEGCYIRYDNNAKCVIFPKGKNTWEGFQRPFKDGDIISDCNVDAICIFKGEGSIKGTVDFYCGISCSDELFIKDVKYQDVHFGEVDGYNFATEEEKAKLFKVIKDNGYKWNAETKTLEKIKERKSDIKTCLNCKTFKDMHQNCPYSPIWRYKDLNEAKSHLRDETDCQFWNEIPKTKTLEKLIVPKFKVGDRIKNSDNCRSSIVVEIKDDCFIIKTLDGLHNSYLTDKLPFSKQDGWELISDKFNINTLKPFDKVLVRGDVGQRWIIDFFGFMDNKKGCPFVCVGHYVIQCVPYNGNEHLLGKTKDCDDFYKTWE